MIEAELTSIKVNVASLDQHFSSLDQHFASLKDDVGGIKTALNSLVSSVGLLLPSTKVPSTNAHWSPSSSDDDSSTDEYYQRDVLCASGLGPFVDTAALAEFFKTAGPVVDVKFAEDDENGLNRSATIRFASAQEATEALKLHGSNCCDKPVFLRRASNGLYTTYVSGFDETLPEKEIKLQLIEHFSYIGDVKGIYLLKDKKSGGLTRGAYINIVDDPAKVVTLDISIMKGRKLFVDAATGLRKAGKVEMRKNRVDASMLPKGKKTTFDYSDDE